MGTAWAEAPVLDLRDDDARSSASAGSKAAALARASRFGFPVVPGFVIPVVRAGGSTCRAAWSALSEGGRVPLVVRSSSSIEDSASSSMAGRFESVLDVRGWDAFVEAVTTVRRSGDRVAAGAAMAVLVQRAVDADRGGVLFGMDPVSGERGRIVVEWAGGAPHAIVSGRAGGCRCVLSRHGRLLEVDGDHQPLTSRDRRRLSRLARRTTRRFGAPQDVEWAVDRHDRLWLLQSRPVTAVGEAARASGPLLGPGPIGETFPDPLSTLERDLFLSPLRIGIIEALRAIGAVPHRRIAASPVVTTVGGRVAMDLELVGWAHRPRGIRVLDPRPPAHRLVAAWHVGQLRRWLPSMAEGLVGGVDAELAAVPELSTLADDALITLLGRVRQELVRVHAFQILAGMLLEEGDGRSASSIALSLVRAGRAEGRSDREIVARAPAVLMLTAPHVGPDRPLPAVTASDPDGPASLAGLDPREALRLRARWLDELGARAAWALGERLAAAGRLGAPGQVRDLTAADLEDVVAGGPVPDAVGARSGARPGPPLPATFRLTATGSVVPWVARGRGDSRGARGPRGAGGGRGSGRVRHEGTASRGPGEVLVVRVLSPAFAAELDGLAGLVAETGGTLSHLAILARELHVPTVVGVADAMSRLPEGAVAVVDGTTGEVAVVQDDAREVSP